MRVQKTRTPARVKLDERPSRTSLNAMSEVVFVVEEAPEGGFVARGLGASIVTEADTMDDLRVSVRDAVRCHFDEEARPAVIRLHFVRDEIFAA